MSVLQGPSGRYAREGLHAVHDVAVPVLRKDLDSGELEAADALMTLTERRVGPVTILDLFGALTIGDGSGRLKDRIDALVLQGRTSVVLNLAGVRYVDSEGLGQLVGCYTSLAKTTGGLKLLHVGARTMRLLTITRLLTILETFESEDDAVNSFPELVAVASQERES